MYLDRHHVELLAQWSLVPTAERGPLTDDVGKWLSVVFDGATQPARDAFVSSFGGSTEGWPWTAIDPVPLGYEVEGVTIDHAPRALVLLLGAWVLDPDLVVEENLLSDDAWLALAPRLSSWDPQALLPLITDDGWLEPPPSPPAEDEPVNTEPTNESEPVDEQETKPVGTESPGPPSVPAIPWYRRTSFLVGAGVAATTVAVVVAVRLRR